MIFGISVDISDCVRLPLIIEKYGHIVKHIQIYLDNSSFNDMQYIITDVIDRQISYSFHAHGELNMADIEQYGIAIQTVDMLSSIGGVFINFHAGHYDSNKQCRNNALTHVVELTQRLCVYAYNKNIAIHIENDIPSNDGCERLGTTLSDWTTLHKVNQPNFYMCYDIGHANISFNNPFIYRLFLSKIGSFHIHNNDGISDQHIPYGGLGVIPLGKVLGELRKVNKYVILENAFDEHCIALQQLSNLI